MNTSRILWGGATSASQYEGGYIDGKGIDTQDCRPYIPRTSNATTATRLLTKKQIDFAKDASSSQYYPFRVGTKGYEHVIEDLELLDELNLDLYRFSISWSRLFPTGEEKEPSKEGIEYYDKIFEFLNQKNIKIFLTMNHYAMPLALVEKYGGWKNRKVVELFVHFSKFVFERWGKYVTYWLPINEINAGYFSPFNGIGLLKEENKDYSLSDVFQGLHHQFLASAEVIKLGKEMNLPGTFGSMIACFCYYPLTPKPEDNYKQVRDEQINQWFCMDVLSKGIYPYYMNEFFNDNQVKLDITAEDKKLLKGNTCDFVSFSYYTSNICSVDEGEKTAGNLVVTTKNPYLKANEWGWQIDPLGMRTTLHKIYDRYDKPVIISENGYGSKDVLEGDNSIHDDYRIEYFEDHFKQIKKAKNEGVDVRAYIAWGIIDIVSAGSCEMDKRYGVVYVDADNNGDGSYDRYKKDSFDWYKDFITSETENN